MRLFRLAVVSVVASVLVGSAFGEFRFWTSSNGSFRIEAEIVELLDSETVRLRDTDGRQIDVKVNQISPADRDYIAEYVKSHSTREWGAPRTAARLEAIAKTCPSAHDALALYEAFFADPTVVTSEKDAALPKFKAWQQLAATDAIRAGLQWIAAGEAVNMNAEAHNEIVQGLEFLRLNNGDLAKECFERASKADPSSSDADFIMGLVYAMVVRDLNKAETHFRECIRRDPSDIPALNNLSLVELKQRNYPGSADFLRTASLMSPRTAYLSQNMGRLLDQSGKRRLPLATSTQSEFGKLYSSLIRLGGSKFDSAMGWLYMLPRRPMSAGGADQPPPADRVTTAPAAAPVATPAPAYAPSGVAQQPGGGFGQAAAGTAFGPPAQLGANPATGIGGGVGMPSYAPVGTQTAPQAASALSTDHRLVSTGGVGVVVAPGFILTTRNSLGRSQACLIQQHGSDGQDELVRAEIVDVPGEYHLALLACPEAKGPPVAFATARASARTDVAIFGYESLLEPAPSASAVRGAVLPTTNADAPRITYGMEKQTRLLGGPVCDMQANVVGLHVGNYLEGKLGIGITSPVMLEFLARAIPNYQPQPPSQRSLGSSAVEARVASSTVVVLREEELMRASDLGLSSPGGYLEDVACMQCVGNGRVECPVRLCSRGTVLGSVSTKVGFDAVAGRDIIIDKKTPVRCDVCKGTDSVKCSICRGTGNDPELRR